MIMRRQKMTLLIMGLMCFSPVSSLLAVMCHGSDGHIALEPAAHNHCECPEAGEGGNQAGSAGPVIDSSAEHEHCRDTLAASYAVADARKNVKISTQKVLAATLSLKSISTHTTSVCGDPTRRGYELSSFFAPLRTVILLA
ncbi:MAG: hypothetical protein ACYTE5_01050 [Planctomycetota bacterium]|jgi:hypothetical protein